MRREINLLILLFFKPKFDHGYINFLEISTNVFNSTIPETNPIS